MRWPFALALLLGALFVAAALWILNRPGPAPSPSQTLTPTSAPPTSGPDVARQVNEGQVTLAVTWQGPKALVFAVAMDTHSGSLDGYDLGQLAMLRTDQGREVRPSAWDAPPGGHHRQGTLTFPATTASGSPVLDASTRAIELIIRNMGDVPERIFRWTL